MRAQKLVEVESDPDGIAQVSLHLVLGLLGVGEAEEAAQVQLVQDRTEWLVLASGRDYNSLPFLKDGPTPSTFSFIFIF